MLPLAGEEWEEDLRHLRALPNPSPLDERFLCFQRTNQLVADVAAAAAGASPGTGHASSPAHSQDIRAISVEAQRLVDAAREAKRRTVAAVPQQVDTQPPTAEQPAAEPMSSHPAGASQAALQRPAGVTEQAWQLLQVVQAVLETRTVQQSPVAAAGETPSSATAVAAAAAAVTERNRSPPRQERGGRSGSPRRAERRRSRSPRRGERGGSRMERERGRSPQWRSSGGVPWRRQEERRGWTGGAQRRPRQQSGRQGDRSPPRVRETAVGSRPVRSRSRERESLPQRDSSPPNPARARPLSSDSG